MTHYTGTMKTGKPCKRCGGNLYYKARSQCVCCHMAQVHERNHGNKDGWPKRLSRAKAEEQMQGVNYGDEEN